MNDKAAAEKPCITTFSKVTATISHEIKNALSIISENAGLLDDLAQVTPPDEGVDPERVKRAAATVMRQVSRANEIMGNVNRFAHSADKAISRDSLQSICALLIALTQRQALSNNVTIDFECAVDLEVNTYVLHLETVLYLTLRSIIDHSETGEPLRIEISRPDEQHASVSFETTVISEKIVGQLRDDSFDIILELLKGSVTIQDNTLTVTFCGDIDSTEC